MPIYNSALISNFLEVHCPCASLVVTSFSIDSREVMPGGLFFALHGEKNDGHAFLKEVAQRGGIGAVVSKEYRGGSFGLHLFYVFDVLKSLQKLAKKILERKNIRIIGVTGSVGKTTTKEFIYEILKEKFYVHKTSGNRNTQRTLPLAVLHADALAEIYVLEMGMTHYHEIEQLVNIAPPEIVVLTPIVLCHIENFSGIEEIACAKSEIFTSRTKYSIIHAISIQFSVIKNRASLHRDIYPKDLHYSLPVKERHLQENVSAAVIVAKYLGLCEEEIIVGVNRIRYVEHRYEKKEKRGFHFIDDSYNANLLSMTAAFESMPNPSKCGGGRKIAVLGSMVGMGKYSREVHLQVAQAAILHHIEILFCIGADMEIAMQWFIQSGRSAWLFVSREELKQQLFHSITSKDVILIKGSNVHQLWKILE